MNQHGSRRYYWIVTRNQQQITLNLVASALLWKSTRKHSIITSIEITHTEVDHVEIKTSNFNPAKPAKISVIY